MATFMTPQVHSVPETVLDTKDSHYEVLSDSDEDSLASESAMTEEKDINPESTGGTGEEQVSTTSPIAGHIDGLADRIIECESNGRNVEIIDTNGEWSRGIAQFQDKTWDWMSHEAGVVGSSTEPEKARAVLVWALQNDLGRHWTCFRMIQNGLK